tara:strand:- start:38600 stop:42853 length:4254 start_codon:yes stop_codon:yes gene_type:complete
MVWQRIISRLSSNHRMEASRPRNRQRRRLMLQHLTRRELLAADIGAIGGVVFTDQALDGLTADDPRLAGVQVQIFEDTNSDNTFDGGDLLVGTDTTDANGEYSFDGLSLGTYFVEQATVAGQTPPAPVMVEVVNDAGVQVQAIDTYETATAAVTADSGTPSVSDFTAAAEAIGGERDIQVTHASGTSDIEVEVDAAGDTLTVSTGTGTSGSALLQYDGIDGTITLDATGLANQDLSLGSPFAGLDVSMGADNPGGTLELRVYTSATDFSTRTINIPDNAGVPESIFVPFNTFTASGAGADFTDVGAIEAVINTVANLDVSVTIVESLRPDVVVTNLANIQTVSLGGQLFVDNDSNGQNNGTREGTEPGLTGIIVELYQLAGPNDVVDPSTTVATATTSTGANGTYTFANLDPGHYAVNIPSSQFGTGASLFGFANSTGNDPASDPDDNVDDDDNGTLLASGDVSSGTITLQSNSEPIDDDDTDANTNTTVDFGFFPQVDLSITKTVNVAASNLRENGQVVFDISILNDTPTGVDIVTATNVMFSDNLPNGLTFVEFRNLPASAAQPVINGQNASVNVGSIDADQTPVEFQIVANIGPNLTDDIVNTAGVATTDQVDVAIGNNLNPATVDLTEADLVITKTDASDPVNAGDQLTYVIRVDNNGPDSAEGIVVVDDLPDDVTYVANSGTFLTGTGVITEPAAAGDDVVINVGSLANGAFAEIQITVTVAPDAASPLDNVASVTSDPNNDPDDTNNSTNEETVVERSVDVAIAKSIATGSTVTAGGQFTYEIEVTNNGPSEARGVQVTDALDDALTFVSFDAGTSGVTRVTGDDQNLTFNVGTLAAQQTETFTITVSLAASATGNIDNQADISTTDNDSDPDNDFSAITTPINRDVALGITKTVNVTTAVPGVLTAGSPAIVYTIDVTNNGISDATGVFVTDDLSDELNANRITSITVNPGVGTVSNNTTTDTPRVDFGTIPAGETRQFTITAEIPAGATGVIDNEAIVDSDTTNPVTSTEVTTTLTPQFDLIIDKSVNGSTNVGPGSQVTYTIVVSHDTDGGEESPSTATGVVITDNLPAGMTFSSATLGGSAVTLTPDANGDVVFPEFDLASGATQTATIVATVDTTADGVLNNVASITTDAGETDTTNNSDNVDVTATPRAELTVTKTVDNTESQVGGTLVYTVEVTNSGPSPATNVEAVDVLPAGVTFVSGTDLTGATFTASTGDITVSGQTITVNGGTLAANDSFSFTIMATVNTGVTVDQVNNVSVTTDTTESNPNNNSAQVTTAIDPLTASIAGSVFVDLNNNGVQDTGEGIEGVTLTLAGTDSLGNAVNATATTNANGDYLFANLAAGTYAVTESQPAGFRDGAEAAGTGATATVLDDMFTNLGLAAEAQAINFDFIERNEGLSKRRFLASS